MGSTFVLMIASIYVMYVLQSDYDQFNQDRMSTTFGMVFLVIATGLFAFKAGFFVYTLYRYFRYKSIESVSNEELPTCTVIVPAYNEGKQVYATLMSLANSDYPVEKLQLLSIDDGSKDDTWYWMQEAKRVLGDRVVIYQQPKNMGKRHALYRGFNEGTGEVFVTVDSDSIVKKDTLRNLVSPFVTNEKCGAVAGNIRVLNNEKALIPKMLDVSFVLSFEFVRSAESSLNSVLCTPGALAAYRRTAVFACLDAWINQTFMGQPSDIGEDRAMTNMILKQGYHVLFQRNAYAYTNVPKNIRGFTKCSFVGVGAMLGRI
jgi:hyaluronan synthase